MAAMKQAAIFSPSGRSTMFATVVTAKMSVISAYAPHHPVPAAAGGQGDRVRGRGDQHRRRHPVPGQVAGTRLSSPAMADAPANHKIAMVLMSYAVPKPLPR